MDDHWICVRELVIDGSELIFLKLTIYLSENAVPIREQTQCCQTMRNYLELDVAGLVFVSDFFEPLRLVNDDVSMNDVQFSMNSFPLREFQADNQISLVIVIFLFEM